MSIRTSIISYGQRKISKLPQLCFIPVSTTFLYQNRFHYRHNLQVPLSLAAAAAAAAATVVITAIIIIAGIPLQIILKSS